MKNKLLTFVALLSATTPVSANPVLKTISAGGFEREYLIYTPNNQEQEKARGILVCLHGFDRTMNDFFGSYNAATLADSLNLIIAAPQALPEQNASVKDQVEFINSFTNDQISLKSVWGCGLRVKVTTLLFGVNIINEELNRDIDDVNFIDKMINAVLEEYSLPDKNIFIFGTSMGGYMTYQYALRKGERLSGIISAAGSMGLSIKGMDYKTKVPVCDFHSLTDEVVPYSGSSVQYLANVSLAMDKAKVIEYWTQTNATGSPKVEQVKNYPSTNGITVEKITYPDSRYEVIHYKAKGASHSYFFQKENGDCMDHYEEIARFIKSHFSGSSTKMPDITAKKSFFYPNPVQDMVYFNDMDGIVSVYDLSGRQIYTKSFRNGQADLSFLKQGIYVIQVHSGNSVQVERLIK